MNAYRIAAHRFGLGPRAGDRPPDDPKRWLVGQLDRFDPAPPVIAAAPGSSTAAERLAAFYDEQRAIRERLGPRPMPMPVPPPMAATPGMAPAMPAAATAADPRQQARQAAGREARATYAACVAARTNAALATDAPFVERLVHFWSNHFAVSADKLAMVGLAATLEFEAIRPHVLGRFADMLMAVERHPAMLVYLDQTVSVGPNSAVGQRVAARGRRKAGLNENLAREILELHTLGVRTGYTQSDVTEFARALTGWSVGGLTRWPGLRRATDATPGSFVFAAGLHEPGERTIVGRRYPAGGEEQAKRVLADLAASPATARHLATKLARHFAGDTPPPAMVALLEQAYLTSNGDLPTVYRAIVASDVSVAIVSPFTASPRTWRTYRP